MKLLLLFVCNFSYLYMFILDPYTGIKCTSNSSSRSTSPHTFIPSPKTIVRTPVASPKNTKYTKKKSITLH